jgi:hypothetical protein
VLRALVVVLLLANLVFFTWTQGWLDSLVGARAIGDREPERLARQVLPETVRILSTGADAQGTRDVAVADSVSTQPSCLEAGPFGDAEIKAAQAAAQAAMPTGTWESVKTDRPSVWTIYMGKFANREALIKKEEELKRRKIAFEELLDNPALALGLSLGRYDDRAAASKALDQLAQQGLHTGRVTELTPASTSVTLRVEKADSALAAQLTALKSDALGKGFTACVKTAAN